MACASKSAMGTPCHFRYEEWTQTPLFESMTPGSPMPIPARRSRGTPLSASNVSVTAAAVRTTVFRLGVGQVAAHVALNLAAEVGQNGVETALHQLEADRGARVVIDGEQDGRATAGGEAHLHFLD